MADEHAQPKEDLTPFQLIRFLVSCTEAGEKLTVEDEALIERVKANLRLREQQLHDAQEQAEKGRAAIRENVALRQEIERLKALGEKYLFSDAQARALLMDWLPNEFSLRPGRAEALEKRTRAFLVQHKEEQP
jgi:hypothetical protein